MREAHVSVDESAFDAMGIEELVALGREAGLRSLEELACHGTGAVVQADVETPMDEERLDDLEYVTWWERVADVDDTYRYVVSFVVPDLSAEVASNADELVGTCDPTVEDRGVSMAFVGTQNAIRGTIGGFETTGVHTRLQKLGEFGGQSNPLDRLTDRQREVLETAFDLGYFEVPREASTEDVADRLDLDPSTITEHLQRAEHNLLSELLSG